MRRESSETSLIQKHSTPPSDSKGLWLDDEINIDPSCGLVASASKACFYSTGKLYPGSRGSPYHSGRAMVWIRTLVIRKSGEFASAFPLPIADYAGPTLEPDLYHLLLINTDQSADFHFIRFLRTYQQHTHPHPQWISNALSYISWTNRTPPNFEFILPFTSNLDVTVRT